MYFNQNGEQVLNQVKLKMFRSVRKNIINLLESIIRQVRPENHKEFLNVYEGMILFPL